MKKWVCLPIQVVIFAALFTVSLSRAQEYEPLSGFSLGLKVFFDYSSVLSRQGPIVEKYGKGWNSFQFRRAYVDLDHRISDSFKVKFRTDADREADDKARVYIKNLYLEWDRIIPQAGLYLGMIPTPGKALSESVWGYRGIERTLIHVYKQQTGEDIDFFPADLGVGLKGNLGKYLFYHLVAANGAGYSHPEGDKYKKFELQFGVTPLQGLFIAGYIDYERQNPTAVNWTWKGDLLYKGMKLALGFETFCYDDNLRQAIRGGSSLFGNYRIAESAAIFARIDIYEPVRNRRSGEDGQSLILFGFDYSPHNRIHLMPNLRFKSYEDERKTDILGVLTLEIRY